MQAQKTIDEKMVVFTEMVASAGLKFNQHQYDGVKFCVGNEMKMTFGVRGGIVADEMGLGKTLTMIGTIMANPQENTLVVLPPVLLVQWQKEIFKATGHQALLYHGIQKKKITAKELAKSMIVLTTYNAIRPAGGNALHTIAWGRVVFDEAHHLRNKNLAHNGACALNTPIRWLITGTPIQNNATDFYHLCSVLGIDRAIYSDKSLTPAIITAFLLKRNKSTVPAVVIDGALTHTIQVEWSRAEYALAKDVHSTMAFSNVESNYTKQKYAKNLLKGSILQRILRAKQSCVLPALMDDDLKKSKIEIVQDTSKLDAVMGMIRANQDNGAGKLIFCHYRQEIDAVASRLASAGIRHAVFDGRTGIQERQAILTDPNNTVIVLQIQTGCEGLNLQENYSEIYFISPHWNPSVEAQAIGRCHRMGQKKQVHVYRFVMTGFARGQQEEEEEQQNTISLDEYIMTVQTKKQGITATTLMEEEKVQ